MEKRLLSGVMFVDCTGFLHVNVGFFDLVWLAGVCEFSVATGWLETAPPQKRNHLRSQGMHYKNYTVY